MILIFPPYDLFGWKGYLAELNPSM